MNFFNQSFSMIRILFSDQNLFELLQSLSIITIFFNYYNLFQLSQSFSIITFFFIRIFLITIFFSLFATCDTILIKNKTTYKLHHPTHIFYCQNTTKICSQFYMFLIYAFYFEVFSFCV